MYIALVLREFHCGDNWPRNEGFMMELEDLNLCIQENIIKQVNETIMCYDS